MFKTLFLSSVLACAFLAASCSQTEQALTDEPEVAPVEQTVTESNTETSVTSNKIQHPAPAPKQVIEAPVSAQTLTQFSEKPPKTQLRQTSVVRTPFPVKRCMNLGNALEAPNEGDWGYRIRKRDLQIIKQAGFDTIRLPVRWDNHTANRAPYQIDASFMARVQDVVRQAQAVDLGVIVDVHHFEKLMRQPKRQEARFLAIWTQISKAFKGAPANVYFEVLNEPTLEIKMSQVNALYAKVIPIIRANHPKRKIILGGNSWNSVERLDEVRWPDDPNIIATFHDYGPHAFTHQGAEWSEPAMPLGRLWGGREDADELKSTYQIANAFLKKTGLPILVGEFGVIDKVPQAQRMNWTKIRRQTMEANNMAWCVWDFSGAFKSYDAGTEQWLPGVQDALFGP
ncbi:MAG: glycoside hydrolase family 5 protein [Acidimicrobiales bacterium]|nr:glycoside hydrolase family 5 protein [Hyphomonadaceae bacterium]RZV44965.1 MAG: glycoside hydrolase family 5 protein [Acidimicrobiales bacterium]